MKYDNESVFRLGEFLLDWTKSTFSECHCISLTIVILQNINREKKNHEKNHEKNQKSHEKVKEKITKKSQKKMKEKNLERIEGKNYLMVPKYTKQINQYQRYKNQ